MNDAKEKSREIRVSCIVVARYDGRLRVFLFFFFFSLLLLTFSARFSIDSSIFGKYSRSPIIIFRYRFLLCVIINILSLSLSSSLALFLSLSLSLSSSLSH